MTPEEARVLVDNIKMCADDPEAAHGMEDDLYHRVVRSVSSLLENDSVDVTWFDVAEIIAVALIALETEDISFPRWMA